MTDDDGHTVLEVDWCSIPPAPEHILELTNCGAVCHQVLEELFNKRQVLAAVNYAHVKNAITVPWETKDLTMMGSQILKKTRQYHQTFLSVKGSLSKLSG